MIHTDENTNTDRIMRAVIRRYGGRIPHQSHQDIMHLAMARCLKDFNASFGQQFTTSLHRFTDWECKNFLRSERRAAFRRPLRLCDLPEPAEPVHERQEDIDHIHECMHMLCERDRTLIEQHYLLSMTYREIGEANGYGKAAAHANVQRAVDRLRRLCGV